MLLLQLGTDDQLLRWLYPSDRPVPDPFGRPVQQPFGRWSPRAPGIVEMAETPGADRRAELPLTWHRGEPRAALRTHSWLLGSSGFTRFILPTSSTLSLGSTETKATLLENLKDQLQRIVVIIDY